MNEMQITPYEGIGPVRLGMSRADVRAALAIPFREFKRTPEADMPADAFPTIGVYVSYKPPGVCAAVEVASPAEPVMLGKRLIGQPFGEVLEWLNSLDQQVNVDETGLTSLRFGVGLYVPALKNGRAAPVEAVIVFERGYYGPVTPEP
jgi:hypothetical protein